MTPADAVTEPIERIVPVSGERSLPVPVARSMRRARRRRLLGDIATYTALTLATLVALGVALLEWLEHLSLSLDLAYRMFATDVREVVAVERGLEWGLPTLRVDAVGYDGAALTATHTVGTWVYAPVVVGLLWWVVVRARLRRPPLSDGGGALTRG